MIPLSLDPLITVTGADERTSIPELRRLVDLSPGDVEIGLLWTKTPEGRNRYPSEAWIADAVQGLTPHVAVHICGGKARLERPEFLAQAGRVQVNGTVTQVDLVSYCAQYAHVITQWRVGMSPYLLAHYPPTNHQLLVDASGGEGKSPEGWQRPQAWSPEYQKTITAAMKPVGYAGGLGPHNLPEELPKIDQANVGGPTRYFWVDMEGRLRTPDDWFSIPLAAEAIRQVLAYHEK